MEALAKKMIYNIDKLCIDFHYFKKTNAFDEEKSMTSDIQKFIGTLCQGIQAGEIEDEKAQLQNYILQVLNDYMEAVKYQDVVLMIDTLDYGLRDLLKIFVYEENGEEK